MHRELEAVSASTAAAAAPAEPAASPATHQKQIATCIVCHGDFVSVLCTKHTDGRFKQRCDACERARQVETTATQDDMQRAADDEFGADISPLEQLLLWQSEAHNHGQLEIAITLQAIKACLSGEEDYIGIPQIGYTGLEGQWEAFSTTPGAVQAGVLTAPYSTLTDVSLTMAEARALQERVHPLLRAEVLAQRPYQFSPKDAKSLMDLCENARRGVVEFSTMQKQATGWRDNQLKLRAIKTPQDAQDAIAARKLAVYASLSDSYQAVRVSNLRLWCEMVVQCENESPWRMHWPESRDDDRIMTDFIMIMSLRNTSYSVVEHAKMHVIEYHLGYLSRSPPPFPIADWNLKKLKLSMAKEKPEGRRVRPGLGPTQVSDICHKLHATLLVASPVRQRLYANAGAAVSFVYEKALRTGEACPGDGYSPKLHLSRSTIAGALLPRAQLQSRGDALIVQPPVRKTSYTNAVTAQLTNQPLVFDTRSEMSYSFTKWGSLLEEYDACRVSERSMTPAFRTGGAHSVALATADIRSILCTVAQSVIPDWMVYSYGAHSLRIGRENAWRETKVASPEFLNGLTTHTTSEGRKPYSRQQVAEILLIDRAAESVQLAAVETTFKFDADRSTSRPAVYMAEEASGGFTRVLSTTASAQLVDSGEELDESDDDGFLPSLEDVLVTVPGSRKRAAPDGTALEVKKKPRGRARKGMAWDATQGRWAVKGQPTVFAWTQ